MAKLLFRPVDLSKTRELTIAFRADSFVISFGNAQKFYMADGKGDERYITWLERKIEDDSNSVVHVYEGDQIIGQIEMGRLYDDPSVGYVNLYYLIQEKRGKGLGKLLDRHVETYFRSLGLRSARLSVSPTNTRAFRFYEKRGWRDLGPRPENPEVHVMDRWFGTR